MPNLLHAVTPTDADIGFEASWNDITGYSDTFTPVDSASIILLIATVPIDIDAGDGSTAVRFFDGTAQVGPDIQTHFADAAEEGAQCMLAWAVEGWTGSKTITVQGYEVQGAGNIETAVTGGFVIIEFLDGEAILHDSGALTSAKVFTNAYTDITDHVLTFTPDSSASINLMIGSAPTRHGDYDAVFWTAMSLAGTPQAGAVNHFLDKDDDSVSFEFWNSTQMQALTGQSGEITLSQEGKDQTDRDIIIDVNRTRYFQVLEMLGSTMHHNASGTDDDEPTASYTDMLGMSTTETITDTGSVVLMLANTGIDPSHADFGGDSNCRARFNVGASDVGPEIGTMYWDTADEGGGSGTAWATTGTDGSIAYKMRWLARANTVFTLDNLFQVIECKGDSTPPVAPTRKSLPLLGVS